MTNSRPTILVIDDDLSNLLILEDVLSAHFNVHTESDGQAALEWLADGGQTNLILSDVVMPRMDGYALCRRLKTDERTRDIPLLFLSSLAGDHDEARGLMLGAEDFIHKPISPPVVLARVRNHLELARARAQLSERNAHLELMVLDRSRELLEQKQQVITAQEAIITAFCSLSEARDNETGYHILRTQHFVEILAQRLRHHPRFAMELDEESIALIVRSAPLHDIGKVGVPDAILLKPGALSEEEWGVMRQHTICGRDAIERSCRSLGVMACFLRYATEIAFCHHEKWDGSGYPQGLVGDAIPLSARLMALADVYDALITKRPYKPPISHERTVAIIKEGRGSHFDPDIVDAFIECTEDFRAIATSFHDPEN